MQPHLFTKLALLSLAWHAPMAAQTRFAWHYAPEPYTYALSTFFKRRQSTNIQQPLSPQESLPKKSSPLSQFPKRLTVVLVVAAAVSASFIILGMHSKKTPPSPELSLDEVSVLRWGTHYVMEDAEYWVAHVSYLIKEALSKAEFRIEKLGNIAEKITAILQMVEEDPRREQGISTAVQNQLAIVRKTVGALQKSIQALEQAAAKVADAEQEVESLIKEIRAKLEEKSALSQTEKMEIAKLITSIRAAREVAMTALADVQAASTESIEEADDLVKTVIEIVKEKAQPVLARSQKTAALAYAQAKANLILADAAGKDAATLAAAKVQADEELVKILKIDAQEKSSHANRLNAIVPKARAVQDEARSALELIETQVATLNELNELREAILNAKKAVEDIEKPKSTPANSDQAKLAAVIASAECATNIYSSIFVTYPHNLRLNTSLNNLIAGMKKAETEAEYAKDRAAAAAAAAAKAQDTIEKQELSAARLDTVIQSPEAQTAEQKKVTSKYKTSLSLAEQRCREEIGEQRKVTASIQQIFEYDEYDLHSPLNKIEHFRELLENIQELVRCENDGNTSQSPELKEAEALVSTIKSKLGYVTNLTGEVLNKLQKVHLRSREGCLLAVKAKSEVSDYSVRFKG